MKEETKICHYLDLPIQHADDILREWEEELPSSSWKEIDRKASRRNSGHRTSYNVDHRFPGETQESTMKKLMEFVDEMEFDRLGVFTYSPEEDTPAADMPDQMTEEVKKTVRQKLWSCSRRLHLTRQKT